VIASAARGASRIFVDDRFIRVDGDGRLMLEDLTAEVVATEFGTPLYATSEGQIRANVRRLRGAFEARWERVTLLFATKSNANLAVRRILLEEGVGGDCFGLGELELSLLAGVPGDQLVLNGSNKQADELRKAISAGVTVNVDDPTELDLVASIAGELDEIANVCFRVLPFSYADPAALSADLASIARDRSHDKWGMDRPTILHTLPRALAERRVHLRGLHLHVSRLRATPEHFALAAQLIASCIAELRDRFDWQPELLDFGGGFPHERDPESGEPAGSHPVGAPEEYAETVTSTLRQALNEHSLREPHLLLEPGRRLVSNATVLLTRVGVIKQLPTGVATWVNVDASTNHCLRASLQNYYYEIVHATRAFDVATAGVNVVGPTCVVDLIGKDRVLPPLSPGDLLGILDVGGYAEVLANQFNMVPRPAHVLIAGDRAELIRRRETIEDLLAPQLMPSRLAQ
jgi:diaminopimelate decarboxylase